jgi:hypothetical protein
MPIGKRSSRLTSGRRDCRTSTRMSKCSATRTAAGADTLKQDDLSGVGIVPRSGEHASRLRGVFDSPLSHVAQVQIGRGSMEMGSAFLIGSSPMCMSPFSWIGRENAAQTVGVLYTYSSVVLCAGFSRSRADRSPPSSRVHADGISPDLAA